MSIPRVSVRVLQSREDVPAHVPTSCGVPALGPDSYFMEHPLGPSGMYKSCSPSRACSGFASGDNDQPHLVIFTGRPSPTGEDGNVAVNAQCLAPGRCSK